MGKIAESSKLYRQDIYKIIPKLERKGVISKTLGKPLVVRAMPVKIALKTLVSKERISALQRIKRMEVHLEELSKTVSNMYEIETRLENEKAHFSLLTQENEITNMADLLYEKAKTECDIVASVKLLTTEGPKFHERFRKATKNGAEIRLLIEAPRKEKAIEAAVERVRPNSENFCETCRLQIAQTLSDNRARRNVGIYRIENGIRENMRAMVERGKHCCSLSRTI